MLETKTIAATGPRPGIRERLAPVLASPAGRRGLWILGGGVVAAGLATNWSWLTAIGVAPLLLAAAPCLAMCALGLCAMGRNSSCKTDSAPKTANTASKSTRVVAADTDEDDQDDRKEVGTRPALRAIETVASAEPAVSTETEVQPTKERNITHA